MNVNNGVVTFGAAAGAMSTGRGIWNDGFGEPILNAPDANESVCVKFL
jgi:peptidase E